MTFTIIGIDKKNKELGIACFSKAFAVGGIAPAIDLNIGAVGTQSYPNVLYKEKGLELMKKYPPEKTISLLIDNDSKKEIRQVLLMNKKGEVGAFTGRKNVEWAGSKIGKDCICAGNMLAGENVLNKMIKSFENARGELADRLLLALRAGHNAGGDRREKRFNSSGLIVEKKGRGVLGIGNRYLDIRIDYSTKNSIEELTKILKIKRNMDKLWKKRKSQKPMGLKKLSLINTKESISSKQ
ncbi:MAG: DUF1028 domain-containing protein [Candidatus Nanoarchaeia archaeon]